MKIRFGYEMFFAMAVSIVGIVAAGAQSGVVGAQVLPTADLSSARGAVCLISSGTKETGQTTLSILMRTFTQRELEFAARINF
jgi:hypothetical protein